MNYRPVRLAVLLDQPITAGGGYEQSVTDALAVTHLDRALCHPIYFTTIKQNIAELRNVGLEVVHLRLTFVQRAYLWIRQRIITRKILRLLSAIFGQNPLDVVLKRHAIDLIYWVSPSALALHTEKYNYIFTLWDLCHRDQVEFPEVRRDRAFEHREAIFSRALPRAMAVIVDSNLGRDNAIRRYGLDSDRIIVRPFLPSVSVLAADELSSSDSIDVKKKYGLEDDYILYPAQFWAHKNHVYLLRGLAKLEERHGLRLSAILPGSDKGNLNHVTRIAQELGLSYRVRFPGFVIPEDMSHLYRQAFALVMPTYFGPTNIPPLEAFLLDTPVIYSDLPGLREQVGEAALFIDLDNPTTLADHLFALSLQPALRKWLIAAGRQRLQQLAAQRINWLEPLLRRYQVIRSTWPAE